MSDNRDTPVQSDDDGIRWTIAAYCHFMDDKQFDLCASLFTEDGEFLRPDGVTTSGRAALLDLFRGPSGPPPGPTRHVMVNHRIDHGGLGIATCVSDFQYWSFADAAQLVTAGRYHDTLAFEDDRWRFRRRAVELIYNDAALRARIKAGPVTYSADSNEPA